MNRKWLKNTSFTILLITILGVTIGAINYGIQQLKIPTIDTTKDKIYSLSQETKDKLKNIDQQVTIYFYNLDEFIEEISYYNIDYSYNAQELKNYINSYQNINTNISIEELENLNTKTEWKIKYGIDESYYFIIVVSEDREKLLVGTNLIQYNQATNSYIDTTEEAITNAILDVTTENKPKVYFYTGHNLYSDNYFQYFQTALTAEANEFDTLDLIKTKKVPENCDVLVITALKEDIKDFEKDAILNYAKQGGDILLLFDANITKAKLPNFQKILDEYGIAISEGVILEGDSNQMISGSPNFVITNITPGASIIKGINMQMNVCLINPAKLTFANSEDMENKQVTKEEFAHVSSKAFYRTDLNSTSNTKIASDEDAAGSTVGAMLTKKINEETESKLIVFGNTVFATNTQIQVSPQYYMYAIDFYNNRDIVLNSISYLTEREDTIVIRKNTETVNYTVTEEQNRIIIAIIFGVPALIVVGGIAVWVTRRRKR